MSEEDEIKMNKKLIDAIWPKIDTSMKGKVIITSTPKGYCNFYELYSEQIKKKYDEKS